jgi:hypothetical protein
MMRTLARLQNTTLDMNHYPMKQDMIQSKLMSEVKWFFHWTGWHFYSVSRLRAAILITLHLCPHLVEDLTHGLITLCSGLMYRMLMMSDLSLQLSNLINSSISMRACKSLIFIWSLHSKPIQT